MRASDNGHADAIKILLTAPGIDVNYANVSLHLLTPSRMQGWGCGSFHASSITQTPAMMTYHPLMHDMYPIPTKKNTKCVIFCF